MANASLARRVLEAIDEYASGACEIGSLQERILWNVSAMEGVDRSVGEAARRAEAQLEHIAFATLLADQPAAAREATRDLVLLLEPIAAEEVDDDEG